jgi:hypothetical protein
MATLSVLNTIKASGADSSTIARKYNITGLPQAIDFIGIKNIYGGVQGSQFETATVKTVTFTAANSTNYMFTVNQLIPSLDPLRPQTFTFNYTSPASGTTNATITTAITTAFAKLSRFQLTASASSNVVTFTSVLGVNSYNFTITAGINVTVASGMAAATNAAGSGVTFLPNLITSIAGTTTVTVTSTAHALSSGMTVNITGYTGTINGGTTWQGRISYASANSFTLDGALGAGGLAVNTATVTLVAQASKGQFADVNANPALNTGTAVAVATNQYAMLQIDYVLGSTDNISFARTTGTHTHYVYIAQCLLASPFTLTTNYAALAQQISDNMHGYVPGGTTADPEAIGQLG